LRKEWRLVFLAFLKPIINGKGYDFKEPQVNASAAAFPSPFSNRRFLPA